MDISKSFFFYKPKFTFLKTRVCGKFHDFHVRGGSTVVYKHQRLLLNDIMKNQSTIVDNMPAFKEIYSLNKPN